jgi:hypothetical protein
VQSLACLTVVIAAVSSNLQSSVGSARHQAEVTALVYRTVGLSTPYEIPTHLICTELKPLTAQDNHRTRCVCMSAMANFRVIHLISIHSFNWLNWKQNKPQLCYGRQNQLDKSWFYLVNCQSNSRHAERDFGDPANQRIAHCLGLLKVKLPSAASSPVG